MQSLCLPIWNFLTLSFRPRTPPAPPQASSVDKAIEMFSDLRQFDEANKWAEEYARTRGESGQVAELMAKQAEWSEEVRNYGAAADIYIKAKKYDRAIAILAKHQWWDKMIHVVRALDKGDARCLGMCAGHFKRAGQFQYAKETLLKMDDTKALITLYVEENKWEDAFLLLHAHPGGCAGGGKGAGGGRKAAGGWMGQGEGRTQ